MPDEVLTNLCSVCHAEPHKYKCPGCGARTCSLPCIKKHKTRTECSGRHNPTDFVPIEKLRTPAGIDHDYNFISAIDRAKQRAERDIVEELKLMREDELHPKDEDKAFYKIWRGDQLCHVVGKRSPAAVDSFDKHVRRRLKEMDIEAKGMPKGMVRQKENITTFNRRNKCINWQVEWFVYGEEGLFDQQPQQQQQQQQGPTRILCKGLDNKPLNQLLDRSIEWHRGQLDYKLRRQQEESVISQQDGEDQKPAPPNNWPTKRKRLREFSHQKTQDPTTGAWPANNLLLQYSLTGQWNQWATYCAASIPLTESERAERYVGWRFYLHQTGKPVPGGKKALIPLGSTETLARVLRGQTVVEFPTVYVFPPGLKVLPEGFVEGSTERRGRKRKVDETDSSESESSSEDSDSESDSDSSSGSNLSSSSDEDEKEDGEVDDRAAKKVKQDTNDEEVRGGRDSRDGNDRNRFNSRGGREQRGRGGRDRGGQRGRRRGQQNPRERIYGGRPDSGGGRDINNSRNTRAGDQSEEEGEIMPGGRPPKMSDIVTEVPNHQGNHRMGVASQVPSVGGQNMWAVNQASMTGAEPRAETNYRATITQQQQQSKTSGLGLVDYVSDDSD